MSQNTKYRPSLSELELKHLENLVKVDAINNRSSISLTLLGKLAPYIAKIDNNGVVPAYELTPRETTLQALGGTDTTAIHGSYIFQNQVYSEKTEYWAACYKVYATNPVSLSIKEIEAAKEHMYLNDLMSSEEIAEFESVQFGADFHGN